MIHFLNDEFEVDGKAHWIEINSAWGDLITFAIGGERTGERFSEEDPIAVYSLDGPALLDPLRFVEDGVKADWIGLPAGPFQAESGSEMQLLDFMQDETSVTIVLKRYNIGAEEFGHTFSYTMTKEDFKALASAVASMTQYSS
jgi:hypothetical protein